MVATRLLIGTLVPAAIMFGGNRVAAAQTDSELKRLLVGSWTLDAPNAANDAERSAVTSGQVYVQRYNSDGSVVADVYRGKFCGNPVSHNQARWNVANGILITESNNHISQDKILSVTPTKAVFEDVGTNLRYNRLRVSNAECRS
jgi:hypothetical protein